MDRKLFTIVLVAVFLIASVGFISAADISDDATPTNDISVKIRWDDNGQTSERPNSVTVDLIKNGKVVDTKTLYSSNSWSATFKVQDDGSYSIKQKTSLSDYSVSTIGDAHNGFMIINTLKSDVLAASEDDNNDTNNLSTENEEIIITADNTTHNETITEENNSTDENTTDNTSTNDTGVNDNNTTDISTNNSSTNKKNNNTTVINKQQNNTKNSSTNNKHQDNTKNMKKATKLDKKPNVTKAQLRNTGIPIAVLVVAVFAAAFVPFSRKK